MRSIPGPRSADKRTPRADHSERGSPTRCGGNQGGGIGIDGVACAMLIVRVNTANATAAKTRQNRRICIPPGRLNVRSFARARHYRLETIAPCELGHSYRKK